MTATRRIELIARKYGQCPAQQLAKAEVRAAYWDGVQIEADKRPGSYVPGAFKARADEYRTEAAEIAAYMEGGDLS